MKLGLIGCGKMGGALLRGAIKANLVKAKQVTVFDKIPAAIKALQKDIPGLTAAPSADAVVAKSDVVLLAVKPQDMQVLLETVAAGQRSTVKGQPLFLSIAAGITLKQLEAWLGGSARVIRSMPNTPALILQGAAAFARGKHATDQDSQTAAKMLGAVGTAQEVPEKLLDAVTGLMIAFPKSGAPRR